MSVITMIKEIKAIHPEYVAIIKIGSFYNVYMKDSYILSYLFGYKLRDCEQDIKTCGFPEMSLKKVISMLEIKKINYLIIDRRNNYDIDEKFEMGNLNKYNEIYNKAKKQSNTKERIDNITKCLYDNIDKKNILNIIKNIEQVMYE